MTLAVAGCCGLPSESCGKKVRTVLLKTSATALELSTSGCNGYFSLRSSSTEPSPVRLRSQGPMYIPLVKPNRLECAIRDLCQQT